MSFSLARSRFALRLPALERRDIPAFAQLMVPDIHQLMCYNNSLLNASGSLI